MTRAQVMNLLRGMLAAMRDNLGVRTDCSLRVNLRSRKAADSARLDYRLCATRPPAASTARSSGVS